MKQLNVKQRLGVIFLIVLLFAFLLYPSIRSWQNSRELNTNEQKIAQADEKMHIIPAKDDLKIDAIVAKVQKTGSISDFDLNYLIALLKANNGFGDSQEIARVTILAPLEELKIIPSLQKEKIYEAVIPMLGNDPVFNDELDKIGSMRNSVGRCRICSYDRP